MAWAAREAVCFHIALLSHSDTTGFPQRQTTSFYWYAFYRHITTRKWVQPGAG